MSAQSHYSLIKSGENAAKRALMAITQVVAKYNSKQKAKLPGENADAWKYTVTVLPNGEEFSIAWTLPTTSNKQHQKMLYLILWASIYGGPLGDLYLNLPYDFPPMKFVYPPGRGL